MEDRDRASVAVSVLFRGIPLEGGIEELLEACPIEAVPPGSLVLSPGLDNTSVYLILDGQVDVHLDGPGASPYVSYGPGNCVGELSLIDRKRPSASVVAATALRLLVLEHEVVWSLVGANRDFARNLLYVLSGRVRYETQSLVESQRARHVLEQAASTDGLTGLHNRRYMAEAFPRQLARSQRGLRSVSLLVLDVDSFKAYNDTHGHLGGDTALRTVARVLHDNMRPGDMLARYGGEEFVALLPGAGAAGAMESAERLRAAVEAASVLDDEGQRLPSITVSIGVAEAGPRESLEVVIKRADDALYRAKHDGRNRVRG